MKKKIDEFEQLQRLADSSEENGFTSTDIMKQLKCGIKTANRIIDAGINANKISPAYVSKRNRHGEMQRVRGYVFT